MANTLFDGTIATSTTQYVSIPTYGDPGGSVGVQVGWRDSTTAATITVEFTNTDASASSAGDAWEWVDSGETIAGPTGTAAGATLIFFENARAAYARLKIVTTAACDFEITSWR